MDKESSPIESCNAKCSAVIEKKYEATGRQKWTDKCSLQGFVYKECNVTCEIIHILSAQTQPLKNLKTKSDAPAIDPMGERASVNLNEPATFSPHYGAVWIYFAMALIVIMLTFLYKYTRRTIFSNTPKRSRSNSQGVRNRRMYSK